MTPKSDVNLPADAPDFIVTRDFAASVPLIWQCWTDPGHLCRWWGPRGFTCPVCEVDLKPGGSFRIVLQGSDGTLYPAKGTFRVIEPLRLIVKDDDLSEHSEEWHDLVDPGRKGEGQRRIDLLTAIAFDAHGSGTRLTVRSTFPSVAIRDSFVKTGMREGWSASLDKLDELSAALKDADREISVTRLIHAPVAKVFRAFSDPHGFTHWWGPMGFTTTSHHMDFRVGGTWSFTMHGPDGTDYPNHVTYTAIEPERRLAYDHGTDPTNPAMFKAVISFAPEGVNTRVNLRLVLHDASQRPHFVQFGAVEGAYDTLSRLASRLEGAQA